MYNLIIIGTGCAIYCNVVQYKYVLEAEYTKIGYPMAPTMHSKRNRTMLCV